jgi:2',3'-cyclic-nucleotide 2'-phosphodiesterase
MRILFLGDIVGKPGVNLVRRALPTIRQQHNIHFVVANAENAADGSGLLVRQYRQLRAAGVDLITMGDHVYKKREIIPILNDDPAICRPANFPDGAPGREFALAPSSDGTPVAAITIMGRTYMRPVECPYQTADRVLSQVGKRAAVVIVDVHAEATADKYLLAHYLKGRVAAIFGTHTHVATADEQIFPGGTAFICDVGMCGPYASILGRSVENVLAAAVTFVPHAFHVASDDVRLSGAVVEVDPATGRASAIQRFHFLEIAAGHSLPPLAPTPPPRNL